ncbi:MAG: hypothetical protein Q4F66_09550 [Clostridium sp.]|nr:hypothetical protein [Clostridium sp.]
MRSRFLSLILSGTLICSFVSAIPVQAAWKQDNTGWWYSRGLSSWVTGWKQIDGKWYYFYSSGYMAHDTTIDGYQLGSDGARIERVFNAGEKWVVNGQWEFSIDSVEVTNDRNKFSDKDPAQVVIINYSYKNLGYTSNYMDLYFGTFTVMDEKGEVAELYPADISHYPKETPVGASCTGAQVAYGLDNDSSQITIQVEEYRDDGDDFVNEKATFKVPVK